MFNTRFSSLTLQWEYFNPLHKSDQMKYLIKHFCENTKNTISSCINKYLPTYLLFIKITPLSENLL